MGSLSAGLQGLSNANVSSGPPVKHPRHKLRWRPSEYDEPPRKHPKAAEKIHVPPKPKPKPQVDCSGPHPSPPSDPCHPPLLGDAVEEVGARRLAALEKTSASEMEQRRELELARAKTALGHLFTGTIYEEEENRKLFEN